MKAVFTNKALSALGVGEILTGVNRVEGAGGVGISRTLHILSAQRMFT